MLFLKSIFAVYCISRKERVFVSQEQFRGPYIRHSSALKQHSNKDCSV